MRKVKALVIAAACLVGLGLLWNSLGAQALLPPGEVAVTPQAQERRFSRAESEGPAGGPSILDLLDGFEEGRLQATNTPASPQVTNTPASPLPAPTNTPAAPQSRSSGTVERAPAHQRAPEGIEPSDVPPVAEQQIQADEHLERLLEHTEQLRRIGVPFQIAPPEAKAPEGNRHQSAAAADPPALAGRGESHLSEAESPFSPSNVRVLGEARRASAEEVSPNDIADQQTFYPVADTLVLEGYPSANVGGTTDMWAGYDDGVLDPPGRTARSLVRFDIGGLPSGQAITGAILRLYLLDSWDYPDTSRTITTYRVTSAWSEGSATWDNRPGFGEAYGSASIPWTHDAWYEFDVTDLVSAWYDGAYSNHGIMIRGPESSPSLRMFGTRDGDYVPQLIVEYSPANTPPNTPSNPSPMDGATGQDRNVDLGWTGGDPDSGDTVAYDVYFEAGDSTPDDLLCNDIHATSCDPGTLAYDTHYYWYVEAQDGQGALSTGPTWDFTTGSAANNPPSEPRNPTPSDGATGQNLNVDLSWTGGDPDSGDTVTYDVYFAANDSTPNTRLCNDRPSSSCDPGTLEPDTRYYWYVIATDNHSASTTGDTWSFVTAAGEAEETCVDVLSNPQVKVLEHGDGTGTVYDWAEVLRTMYYSTQYANSEPYSLVVIDETDGSDPDLVDIEGETWDWDIFGQAFEAPPNLTYVKASYSRLYAEANDTDAVISSFWTLDSEGYLDQRVLYQPIGDIPEGWSNRYWDLEAEIPEESDLLEQLSGRPLAFTFEMISNRADPSEWIWLDDAQVRICYRSTPNVYLPLLMRQPAPQPGPTPTPEPVCSPREPDSLERRGSVDIGAICGGSLGPTDPQDYYSVNLNGASAVRLRLFNLPAGSNYDALIFEDVPSPPPPCHIGTVGDQDKATNCDLNPSKSYFILVNRGSPPAGGPYNLSLTRR